MKKLLLTAMFAMCSIAVIYAQDYRKFRVGMDLGYAIPADYDAGVVFGLEPKFAVTPNIGVGVRWEGALLAAASVDVNGAEGSGKASLNSSFLVTGDYWFLPSSTFRPFLGLGLGAYSLAGTTVTVNSSNPNGDINIGSKTNFGFMLRGGFDVWHMRVTLEYNLAGKDAIEHSANYFGVLFGVYFGGGKKG